MNIKLVLAVPTCCYATERKKKKNQIFRKFAAVVGTTINESFIAIG